MSISHIPLKIKELARLIDRRDVWAASSILLAGLGGYMIGRLDPVVQVPKAVEIRVGERGFASTSASVMARPADISLPTGGPIKTASTSGKYVASKSGSKYHLPTCSGAKSISEANKIWFSSKEEAESAGYSPASTCPGI